MDLDRQVIVVQLLHQGCCLVGEPRHLLHVHRRGFRLSTRESDAQSNSQEDGEAVDPEENLRLAVELTQASSKQLPERPATAA